jgi:hypothetical protein
MSKPLLWTKDIIEPWTNDIIGHDIGGRSLRILYYKRSSTVTTGLLSDR